MPSCVPWLQHPPSLSSPPTYTTTPSTYISKTRRYLKHVATNCCNKLKNKKKLGNLAPLLPVSYLLLKPCAIMQ